MFNKIWKEQIVKPSSNVSIFKPKQGFDLEEEEDDCNKKLEEYANKIKNTRLPFRDSWNSKEFEYYRDFFTRNSFVSQRLSRDKIFFWTSGQSEYAAQSKYYRYNPVPESVACETLEMLKKHNLNGGEDEKEIDGHLIRIDSDNYVENGSYLDVMVHDGNTRPIILRLEHEHRTSMRKGGKNIFGFEIKYGLRFPRMIRSFWDASGYFFNIDWR